jgi:hypothetical protein
MLFAAPDDVFVSEEERARPIYQTGSGQLTQGRGGRATFQNLFLPPFFLFLSFRCFSLLFFFVFENAGPV